MGEKCRERGVRLLSLSRHLPSGSMVALPGNCSLTPDYETEGPSCAGDGEGETTGPKGSCLFLLSRCKSTSFLIPPEILDGPAPGSCGLLLPVSVLMPVVPPYRGIPRGSDGITWYFLCTEAQFFTLLFLIITCPAISCTFSGSLA